MAISQVTDNPAVVEGSSIHQDAKQQLHQYLRTNIQPLMQTGKPLDLKDIFDHVTIYQEIKTGSAARCEAGSAHGSNAS